MATSDDIGARGESIFVFRVMQTCNRPRPYFRPCFLGEKWPAFDFFVELVDGGPMTPFFLVQVRATSRGFIERAGLRRLRVSVAAADIQKMAQSPAPAYVVGVDTNDESAYILGVHSKMVNALHSLPAVYPLDCRNLERLWHEVKEHWQQRPVCEKDSIFSAR
jgi:hypothetical protein